VFLSKSGNNHAGWVNPKFDATLAESALQPDEAKRLAKLEEAEAIVLDDLPVLPVYFYTRHYLCKPYVKGLYNTFQDRHPWKAIRIDPDAVKNGTLEDGT
jgi:oligopeptide transport system substrate-binding protein